MPRCARGGRPGGGPRVSAAPPTIPPRVASPLLLVAQQSHRGDERLVDLAPCLGLPSVPGLVLAHEGRVLLRPEPVPQRLLHRGAARLRSASADPLELAKELRGNRDSDLDGSARQEGLRYEDGMT